MLENITLDRSTEEHEEQQEKYKSTDGPEHVGRDRRIGPEEMGKMDDQGCGEW